MKNRVILHVLFTNNAGSSLLHHIAQSYSDIESLQFADLLRDYFSRRKLKRYRFQEEVLRDLREEREIKSFLQSYDPFIDHYCFDEPIQTPKDRYFKSTLHKAAKAQTVDEVVFAEGVMNHWDEEANVRTNSPITLGQIRGRDDCDSPHPTTSTAAIVVSRRCFISLQLSILHPSCRRVCGGCRWFHPKRLYKFILTGNKFL